MIAVDQIWKRPSFDRSFKKLPPLLQQRVRLALRKLQKSPELPGLHVEPISGADRDLWSCRVNKRVRIIFSRADDGEIVLEFVGDHQSAYRAATWSDFVSLWDRKKLSRVEEDEIIFDHGPALGQTLSEELESTFEDADLVNPPDTVGVLSGLIDHLLSEGTDGRASTGAKRLQSGANVGKGGGLINIIPGDERDRCRETVLALCFDADSFDNRLHETMKHVEYECPDTKVVVFITSKWEPKTWKEKWDVVFENLSAKVVLLLAGPGGLRPIA